jgi:HAMP domain-containing protein
MDVSTLPKSFRGEYQQRRLWRLYAPAAQLGLAAWMLLITLGFAALFVLNTWAAYGRLMDVVLSLAPAAFRDDVTLQGVQYTSVTLILLVAYLLAVLGLASAAVHRLTGAKVALERHARALKAGDYSARVKLRQGDAVYAELAKELNELAAKLQSGQSRH